MKITFLSDNKTEKAACIAEWGLSILVESKGHKVLLDVGSSEIFSRNAKALGIDLADVEALAISHGHFDHTDGMETFAEVNKIAPVYLHKEAIDEEYAVMSDGSLDPMNDGIRWSEEFIERIKPRLVMTEGITKINDNMTLVANIPLLPEYPMTERFVRPDKNNPGQYVDDNMDHEQFLVVEEDRGIFILSGCSHKGVMSIIHYAKELFPGKKILGFIGGMHLYPLTKEGRKEVVDNICNLDLDVIFPVHCTGMDAIIMFRERLGEKCVVASAGDSYEC